MDVEVQGVPREHKTKLQVKLRSFKGEMARYKAEVVRAHVPYYYYPTLLLLSPSSRNPYSPARTATSCCPGVATATTLMQTWKAGVHPKHNGSVSYAALKRCQTLRVGWKIPIV